MAGIQVACPQSGLLHFHSWTGKQEFLCLIDTVGCQIFISRAPEKTAEQPRQVLGLSLIHIWFVQITKIVTDETLKELRAHGTEKFPFQYNREEMQQFDEEKIEWHWHREFEFVKVMYGSVYCLSLIHI